MMNEFNYETLDWELEARRVAKAFEIEKECYFYSVIESNGEECRWLRLKGEDSPLLFNRHAWFNIRYTREYRGFYVVVPDLKWAVLEVEFSWNGELIESIFTDYHALKIARGLFRLGLLTPAIETELWALMTNNSAHEKLEWKLEYEAQNGL